MSSENNTPAIRFAGFTGEWEKRKLGDIVDVRSGKDYKHLSDGPIPVYGTGGYMLSVDKALSYQEDAVGIGRKGTIDKPYILRAPFWTVDTLFYALPQKQCDLYFLFALFQKIDWKIRDESTGVPSLSKTAINEVRVKTSSPEEQQLIGNYFKDIDTLITLHRRKCEQLETLKKSMLEKLFPKEGKLVPELRFAGFTGKWERTPLGEITHRFDNLRVPVSASARIPGCTPYYGANGIQDYVEGYTHDGEFILIAEDGANDDTNYPVNYVKGRIWVNNHAHVLQAQESVADNIFLSFAIGRANFRYLLVGGSRSKLNASTLTKIVISRPTKCEQKKIGTFFYSLDRLLTLHRRKLELLQNIKKACLEKMFV